MKKHVVFEKELPEVLHGLTKEQKKAVKDLGTECCKVAVHEQGKIDSYAVSIAFAIVGIVGLAANYIHYRK